MTLLDTSALSQWRTEKAWHLINQNFHRVQPFQVGPPSPHELPRLLKSSGHQVGVVTSSPRWYAEKLITQWNIKTDLLIAWDDTTRHKPDPEPIARAIQELQSDTQKTFHIGDSTNDVEASYLAGITSIGAGWGIRQIDRYSGEAPDILLFNPRRLLNAVNLDRCGYLAEMLVIGVSPVKHHGAILPCHPTLGYYALGRYYQTEDSRHRQSVLSSIILRLKQEEASISDLATALASFTHWMKPTPDVVVPVPPKPSQKRNRFECILNTVSQYLPSKTRISMNALDCVADLKGYKSLTAMERSVAIQKLYRSRHQWQGHTVLLVDDTMTTGCTLRECSRTLVEAGVSQVQCVALARSQIRSHKKYCSQCGRPMRIRRNKSTQKEFWGCSGYPYFCRHTANI